jgi:hypothetical protein
MKILLLLLTSVTAFAQESPTLQPIGIWPSCGKLGGIFAMFCQFLTPGSETYLLSMRATTANTTGYVYEVRALAGETPVLRTGYLPRVDTPDGRETRVVLTTGVIHDVKITVVEVVSINTQTSESK